MKKFFVVVAAMLLAGCATTAPRYGAHGGYRGYPQGYPNPQATDGRCRIQRDGRWVRFFPGGRAEVCPPPGSASATRGISPEDRFRQGAPRPDGLCHRQQDGRWVRHIGGRAEVCPPPPPRGR